MTIRTLEKSGFGIKNESTSVFVGETPRPELSATPGIVTARPRLSSITSIPGFGQSSQMQHSAGLIQDSGSQSSLLDSSWPSYDHGSMSMSQPQLPSYGLYSSFGSPFGQGSAAQGISPSPSVRMPAIPSPNPCDVFAAPPTSSLAYRPRVSSPLRHAVQPVELQRSWSNPITLPAHQYHLPAPMGHFQTREPAPQASQASQVNMFESQGASTLAQETSPPAEAVASLNNLTSLESTHNTATKTFRDFMPAPRKLPFVSSKRDVDADDGKKRAGKTKRKAEVAKERAGKKQKQSIMKSSDGTTKTRSKVPTTSTAKSKVTARSPTSARRSGSRNDKATGAEIRTSPGPGPIPLEEENKADNATARLSRTAKAPKTSTQSTTTAVRKVQPASSVPVTRKARPRSQPKSPVKSKMSTSRARTNKGKKTPGPKLQKTTPKSFPRSPKATSKEPVVPKSPDKPRCGAGTSQKRSKDTVEKLRRSTRAMKDTRKKEAGCQNEFGVADTATSDQTQAVVAGDLASTTAQRKLHPAQSSSSQGTTDDYTCGQRGNSQDEDKAPCLNCQKAHRGCSRARPVCSQCRRHGLTCSYPATKRASPLVGRSLGAVSKGKAPRGEKADTDAGFEPPTVVTAARVLQATDVSTLMTTAHDGETTSLASNADASGSCLSTSFLPLVFDATLKKQLEAATEPLFQQYEADIARGCDKTAIARFYLECISAARRDIWRGVIGGAEEFAMPTVV
ncbi:hypothetical protein LIA77_09780 [Sarocladium implicatum]|nr:hypothetical protein LIA77_09780 [Sarocladium implicatum]